MFRIILAQCCSSAEHEAEISELSPVGFVLPFRARMPGPSVGRVSEQLWVMCPNNCRSCLRTALGHVLGRDVSPLAHGDRRAPAGALQTRTPETAGLSINPLHPPTSILSSPRDRTRRPICIAILAPRSDRSSVPSPHPGNDGTSASNRCAD